MKKNKVLRIASVLFVAVILTTCAISGTFAKYVSSDTRSDTARVAKWGVTVTGTGETFAKKYETDDRSTFLETYSVESTEKVVAPGTTGNMAAFTITGTPEVAVRVTFSGTLKLGDKWVDSNGAYYCPIEITIGTTGNTTTYKGLEYGSADDFEAAVNAKIATYSNDYAVGTDLSGIHADAPVISWAWPFYKDEAHDVKDTYLGDQAVAGNAAEISLEVTATVTQIN